MTMASDHRWFGPNLWMLRAFWVLFAAMFVISAWAAEPRLILIVNRWWWAGANLICAALALLLAVRPRVGIAQITSAAVAALLGTKAVELFMRDLVPLSGRVLGLALYAVLTYASVLLGMATLSAVAARSYLGTR